MNLVRDKIPEIIESKKGEPVRIEILGENEIKGHLIRKLKEKTDEYSKSKDAEELIDILETVYAIAKREGVTPEELEQKRKEKKEKKGGFDKGIFAYL